MRLLLTKCPGTQNRSTEKLSIWISRVAFLSLLSLTEKLVTTIRPSWPVLPVQEININRNFSQCCDQSARLEAVMHELGQGDQGNVKALELTLPPAPPAHPLVTITLGHNSPGG